jgi:hypothetical protein
VPVLARTHDQCVPTRWSWGRGGAGGVVELEGIEPSSVRRLPDPLRPFPSSWLTAASSPGRVGPEARPSDLSPMSAVFAGCQWSFPTVHHRFWCQAAMVRPRVPLLVAMTLCYLIRSGGESEIVRSGVSLGAPFKESEQLRSHAVASWSRRRNRSAPCAVTCQGTATPHEGVSPFYPWLGSVNRPFHR